MKQLLLTAAFIVSASFCHAQCVMYTCGYTGAMGASYNAKDENLSMEELNARAKKSCVENGGTNCRLAYSSHEAGWWAFMSGQSQRGKMIITVVRGKRTSDEAIEAARNQFWGDDGINYEKGRVSYWLVYDNVR
jgi:hypothetical protein